MTSGGGKINLQKCVGTKSSIFWLTNAKKIGYLLEFVSCLVNCFSFFKIEHNYLVELLGSLHCFLIELLFYFTRSIEKKYEMNPPIICYK